MTDHRIGDAERDADAARGRLENTLDELRARMTPGRMLDEALDYAREGNVAKYFREFGGQVKRNPMPVALVATGLAWLMLGRGGSRAGNSSDFETRYRETVDDYSDLETATAYDTSSDGSSLKDKVSQSASRISGAAGSAYDSATASYRSASDSASSAYRSATKRASGMASGVGQGASDMAGTISGMSRRTAQSVSRLVEEQPLVVGVIGVALGAIIGSAFPATRAENRMIGKTSDDLKRQAGREMSAQVDKAMTVAERAYEGAMKEGKEAVREEGWSSDKDKSDETTKRNVPGVQTTSS